MDLGYEAFERIFGPGAMSHLEAYNVLVSNSGGSFLADLTAPRLRIDVRSPPLVNRTGDAGDDAHLVFLCVTNSYNKTLAVRVESGVCRWICRNGLIFGQHAIRFKDVHHRHKESLMCDIARDASPCGTDQTPGQLAAAYSCSLPKEMEVLEAIWQMLRLTIPRPNPKAPNATQWVERCGKLAGFAGRYEAKHGRTGFSALQRASEWAHQVTSDLPTQRHS